MVSLSRYESDIFSAPHCQREERFPEFPFFCHSSSFVICAPFSLRSLYCFPIMFCLAPKGLQKKYYWFFIAMNKFWCSWLGENGHFIPNISRYVQFIPDLCSSAKTYLNLYGHAKTYPTYNVLAKSYTSRHISCHIIHFCSRGCYVADEDIMCTNFFFEKN